MIIIAAGVTKGRLVGIYTRLRNRFGFQNWWPAETSQETIIGAILAQNVSWNNVVKAIDALKRNNLITLEAIHRSAASRISVLVQPTRFYNQKAEKLKAFAGWLFHNYQGDIETMFLKDLVELRQEMLGIKGLGEETVDSILLYGGDKAVFVIDAYTRRIFSRLGLTDERWSYRDYQRYFMDGLDHDVSLFNDYHAQIVHLGKDYCKKTLPRCRECPLKSVCAFGWTDLERSAT